MSLAVDGTLLRYVGQHFGQWSTVWSTTRQSSNPSTPTHAVGNSLMTTATAHRWRTIPCRQIITGSGGSDAEQWSRVRPIPSIDLRAPPTDFRAVLPFFTQAPIGFAMGPLLCMAMCGTMLALGDTSSHVFVWDVQPPRLCATTVGGVSGASGGVTALAWDGWGQAAGTAWTAWGLAVGDHNGSVSILMASDDRCVDWYCCCCCSWWWWWCWIACMPFTTCGLWFRNVWSVVSQYTWSVIPQYTWSMVSQ